MAKPATRLPDKTQPRLQVLVERSSPDPERPRLSAEVERAFESVDRASAACYASAEDLAHKLYRAADRTVEVAHRVCRVWPPDEE